MHSKIFKARFQYVRECADAFASDWGVNPVLVVDSDMGTPAREKKERRKKSDELSAYQREKLAIRREEVNSKKEYRRQMLEKFDQFLSNM